MTRRSTSITTRLAVMIALILIAGGVSVTLAALAYGWRAAEEAYDKLLAGAAFEITRSLSIVDDQVVVDLPVSAFEILALAPDDRIVYRVMDENGVTITGYDAVPPPPDASGDAVYYSADFRGEQVRLVAVRRLFVERAFVGEVAVVVGQTLRARTALAWDIARNALFIVAAAGLVLIGLTIFAVHLALSPLRRIERALLNRDPKDLSPLDVTAPREVETMIAAIDRFMGRLSRRVTIMQNLIADATHQLRTPMAALRAQAELAGGETDPERLRVIAGRIRNRAVGLSRLTNQLLDQALIIHRADADPQAPVDLRVVAIRVSGETDHDLSSSQDDLHLDLPEEPVLVLGDELSLVEATKNLVNNAFRYGRPPVVLCVRAGGRPAIAVVDHGAGIAEGEWADSGRRFARSAGSAPDSAGLGLSIVNAVAEAHHGRLVFSRRVDGAFCAELEFPGAGDAAP